MKEIFQIADRISILKDGKMVATENTKDTTIENHYFLYYVKRRKRNALQAP